MSEFDTDVKIPRYAASLDFDALWKEFPPADEYFKGPYQRSPEQIREIQNERFPPADGAGLEGAVLSEALGRARHGAGRYPLSR